MDFFLNFEITGGNTPKYYSNNINATIIMLTREDIEIDLNEGSNGRNYLIVIGIDQYQKGISKLQNAVLDAQKFKECLMENYQFESKYCYELYNTKATRKKVIELFDCLLTKITHQDNIVLYFSGHGKYIPKTDKGFLLLSDAEKNNRSTYLPNNEVKDFIKALNPRHAFLIIDSCFSGSIFRSNRDVPISHIYSSPSRYLLTSGRYNELVSDGLPGKHSPFSETLLSILNAKKDIGIWIGDLCRLVLKNFDSTSSNQNPRGETLKELGHEGGEFVFLSKGKNIKDLLLANSKETEINIFSTTVDNNNEIGKTTEEVHILSSVKLAEIKKKIGNGELDCVINELLKYAVHMQTPIYDEIILLERHWEEIQGDIRLGVITTDDKLRLTNKFAISLMSILHKIKKTMSN